MAEVQERLGRGVISSARPFAANGFLPWSVVVVLVMLVATLYRTHGAFTYTLDDPYIHLALARNIFAGHYGINSIEYSAPSSSILWPFILAPFSRLPFFSWMPFVINAVCFILASQLIFRFVSGYVSYLKAVVVTVLVIVSFNLPAVIMMGMEHSLQVLLVLVVALHLVGVLSNRMLFYGAVIVLPLVRYEDMAISLTALAYCYVRGDRRQSVYALLSIVALVGGFSLFLAHLGLGYLPSSVQVKLNLQPGSGTLSNAVRTVIDNVRDNYHGMLFNTLELVFVALISLGLPKQTRPVVVLLLVPVALMYMFGRLGYDNRYQIHVLAYCFVMLWYLVGMLSSARFMSLASVPIAVILVICNLNFVHAALKSPLASKNIHDQQNQMAVIVRDYLREPVAVNDLGQVSLYGNQYILDLFGLGSGEALKLRSSDPTGGWITPLMQRKGVEVAFIYDTWFPKRPSNWVRVGELTLPDERISPAESVVALYAANPAAATRLRSALEAYRNSSALAKTITTIH